MTDSSFPSHSRLGGQPHVAGRSLGHCAWQRVRAEILRRIKAREYAPGELIPTEQELSAELGCARATVNRALSDLAQRGVVERRRRVGTRVSPSMEQGSRLSRPSVRAVIEAEGRSFGYQFLGGRSGTATPEIQSRLMDAQADDIRETEALFLADGTPWCHERRWSNLKLLPGMTDSLLETMPANEWLSRHVALNHGEEILTARLAGDVGAAEALGVDPSEAVLVFDFTGWLGNEPVSFVRHTMIPRHQVRSTSA